MKISTIILAAFFALVTTGALAECDGCGVINIAHEYTVLQAKSEIEAAMESIKRDWGALNVSSVSCAKGWHNVMKPDGPACDSDKQYVADKAHAEKLVAPCKNGFIIWKAEEWECAPMVEKAECIGDDGAPLSFSEYYQHHTGMTWPHSFGEEIEANLDRQVRTMADFEDCLAGVLFEKTARRE
jgi:hypothetical protein